MKLIKLLNNKDKMMSKPIITMETNDFTEYETNYHGIYVTKDKDGWFIHDVNGGQSGNFDHHPSNSEVDNYQEENTPLAAL